jgi:HEXXH motif-containing protein
MSELVERIKLALENVGDQPWFPDLTNDLIEVGHQNLFNDSALSISQYGTARVLAQDAAASRNIVAHLSNSTEIECLKKTILVEVLDQNFARQYQEAGIRFYTTEEIIGTNILRQVEESFHVLQVVPSVSSTVTCLVRSLHLIKPADDEYDVSFSEPQLPFSIFVSVPQKRRVLNVLRVAEAILHEAMHLQLTLIERVVPLVSLTDRKYFSPWKSEYRSPQGVLHALYVFRVLYQFMAILTSTSYPADRELYYLRKRRSQISAEIDQVRSFQYCPELTAIGANFARSLLAR